MRVRGAVLTLALGGCALVNAKTASYRYAFEPQPFMEKLGDDKTMVTVPQQPCDPAASPDPCAQLPAAMGSAATLQCDPGTGRCIAAIEVRLSYPVDLSQRNLPGPVVQLGAETVDVEKLAYWIMSNTVNVPLPPIDLFVAPAAAKDENDQRAVKLGSIAMLPARSTTCGDPLDREGDAAAGGAAVCDLKLTTPGALALAAFVKDYKTPFQLIAHARMVARGGDPLPVGRLDFSLRPTVSFSVLN